MISLRQFLRRPRLLDEAWFALGGAAVGGVVGLAIALLSPPPPGEPFATAPRGAAWLLAVAPGFGFGWCAGLFWSVVLALRARRRTPPWPVAALLPATVLAGGVAFAVAAGGRVAELPAAVVAPATLAAAALATRLWLGRVAGQSAP